MTLVELLVVLGVIGLIVGMSVPGLMGYSKHLRLKTTAQQTLRLIFLARSTAISSHEAQDVLIDQERREIRVVNVVSGESLEQLVRIPSSVEVDVESGGQPVPESKFTFRTNGALDGRSITLLLKDDEKEHTITVTGSTGAVMMAE